MSPLASPLRRAPLRQAVRRLALWLLLLALPWHGVAQATMAPAAGPSGASGGAIVVTTATATDGVPCHTAAAEPADADSGQGATTSCGACAGCCVLGSTPAPLPAAVPRAFAGRLVPNSASPRIAFLTGGPLRPPRHSFA